MEYRKKAEELLDKIRNEQIPTAELQCAYIDLLYSESWCPEIYYSLVGDIPNEKLLTETMLYMVNKVPDFLTVLPQERLTHEICIEAVRSLKGSPGNFIKAIPKKFFDYDLCKEIVVKNPKLIRKIPIEIITVEFIEDLKTHGITFAGTNNYIYECLKINEKLNTNAISQFDTKFIQDNKYKNFQIPIESFDDVFLLDNIKLLHTKKIITLEDLFIAYDQGILGTLIGEKSGHYIKILNTTKLLKCKYFDIDPMIDEASEEDIEDVLLRMGLSHKVSNAFSKYVHYYGEKYSVSDFFEAIRSGDAYKKFKKIKGLGDKAIKEAISCAQIVINYHDKDRNTTLTSVQEFDILEDKESLVSLNNELNKLLEERNRLDKEINGLLLKIQNKINNESKGGISNGRTRKGY